jgi:FlaA1/EpsC-like NDP-sugar epimerase
MELCSYGPILIFGGAGSLGKTLLRRLNDLHSITIFSRDEAKHHQVSLQFPKVKSIIGDIRDYDAVARAVQTLEPHIIINCSAMKQVPTCERYPFEAVQTNVNGTHNLVRAVEQADFGENPLVLSISTDKASKPVNSYGMTKALQERIHLNGDGSRATFTCVRYGNVLESTGSVIPVFKKMLADKKEFLPVTHKSMTRFLLSLDQAVDLIIRALNEDDSMGRIFIPKVKSAKVLDVAKCLIANNPDGHYPEIRETGIRPGEKLDEILVSEEEIPRTQDCGSHYIIHDIHRDWGVGFRNLTKEYSSKDDLMSYVELEAFLRTNGVI